MIRLRALDRKMLRELWRLRGQLLSIGLVVATAVTTLVTMRGTYEALVRARGEYYRDYRLADVWSSLERAPNSLESRLENIAGVADVETRVTWYATLDLPWLEAPGQGLFVSVPESGRAEVDDIMVRIGRYVRPGRANEVMVSEAFFLANGLVLGDTIRAVLNGVRRDMEVVGAAISPTHSYSVPPGALYPDDERYGLFWMSEAVLGPNLDMEDGFNEVAVTLAPGANEVAVIRELDRILDPYGGLGAYGREDQLSYKILNDELESNRTMGTAFPMVFLGVAAFLLNLVLGRLISTQRTEIGSLKAIGYTNREVGLHFLSYSVAAVGLGTLLGALGGVWAGDAMVGQYEEYFKLPTLQYRLSWSLVLIGGGISLLAAVLGGSGAVRRATRLAPAEAMRPEPPARFAPGIVERAGVGEVVSTGTRLILRNLERRPVRAALSSLGVAFSVAILVIGMFMFDGIDLMMDLQFRVAQREDLTVAFNRELGIDVRHELARVPGVTSVEPFVMIPARLRSGHREREIPITGLEVDGRLRRIVSEDGRVHPLPMSGLVLSRMLADRLDVSRGDTVTVVALTGLRQTELYPVTDIVDDLLGVAAYLNVNELRRLTREGLRASGAFLLTDGVRDEDVNAELKRAPAVASVVSPATMLESFQDQLDDSLLIAVFFIVGFASVISVAVIYNGTRIALSERGRELASLRVLGFTRREVATLLFGEQAVITIFAIPIGWGIGYGLAYLVVQALASETYRIPLVVSMQTYTWTTAITLVAAAASAALVRRRLDRMDLIAVLKTRE
ncbi:MAG: ABC transporter permease [Gemmatimonadota bacterium]|nr:ABC transporter permease [Gemmatimonadota bacterium]